VEQGSRLPEMASLGTEECTEPAYIDT